MDAAAPGEFHRLRTAVDVLGIGARQAGDDGVLGAAGDFAHRLEIAFRGDGKAGLDDVDAHVVEHLGDHELLLEGHGRAGALLAVAQRGVEYDDAVLVGLVDGVHLCKFLLGGAPVMRALKGFLDSREPLSAQAQTAQTALRGR